MTTITKKQALAVSDLKAGYTLGHADVSIMKELARIALAALEAEPMAEIRAHYPTGIEGGKQKFVQVTGELPDFGMHLYSAPPVPVVPYEIPLGLTSQIINLISSDLRDHNLTQRIWNACRAAMIATAPQQEAKQP